MLVYWTMYAVPALSALLTSGRDPALARRASLALYFLAFFYIILIGLRFEIGADWFTYEYLVDQTRMEDLGTTLSFSDPGFSLVAWISVKLGAEVYGANMFCGAMLVYGLVQFCRRQDDVWLSVAAAVPYLIIVVGMGYVRQGAAIGLILLSLLQFDRGHFFRSLLWIALAATFHASSVCVLPFMAFAVVRKRVWLAVPVALAGAGLFVVLLQSRLETFYVNYIVAEYDSSGALIRLLMNAVPSLIYIIYRNRFPGAEWSKTLWLLFAVMCLAFVGLIVVSPSTTLLDRIALYFIPIQIYVFGNLPLAMAGLGRGRFFVSAMSTAYYAAIMFVWLNFATHAEYWVPYRFLPLEG